LPAYSHKIAVGTFTEAQQAAGIPRGVGGK
jgi:hypothetical protein